MLYHVTFNRNILVIKRHGILKGMPRVWQNKDTYCGGSNTKVYFFTTFDDAVLRY